MEPNKSIAGAENGTNKGENLATETIAMVGRQCAQLVTIIKCLLVFCGFMTLVFGIVNYRLSQANEKNNQRFLEYLSQYDFVSQDSEGANYYNSGVSGDVINGAGGIEE